MDEAICTVDLDWRHNMGICDDELRQILFLACPEGVELVAFFDCCHSGTMSDMKAGERLRTQPQLRAFTFLIYRSPTNEKPPRISLGSNLFKLSGENVCGVSRLCYGPLRGGGARGGRGATRGAKDKIRRRPGGGGDGGRKNEIET